MTEKTFKVVMSERCYRFKPDALVSHAPGRPGVYEFVIFDRELRPIVLFVGLASPGTVRDALTEHLMGRFRPTADELLRLSPDVYFDFVASADAADAEDWKDVAGALAAKHRPRLNPPGPPPSSGRYARVAVEEAG